ncbi:retrieval of early ER protein Rer1 [Dichotomocladium elegans]|nr:retrieval of early ER protein Rer1 [Dichotomocladium elegans]
MNHELGQDSSPKFLVYKAELERRWQRILDDATPHVQYRWIGTSTLLVLFIIRILYAQGWYIIAYTLAGIYLLNLFLAFLSPKFDPSIEMDAQENEMEEGPSLPMKADEEFKPFIRRLPEFKFWYRATKGTTIGLVCSFFSIFDIPVFWPILLVYFCILFGITMRRQIKHMIKYKYIPFDWGKKSYGSGSNRNR